MKKHPGKNLLPLTLALVIVVGLILASLFTGGKNSNQTEKASTALKTPIVGTASDSPLETKTPESSASDEILCTMEYAPVCAKNGRTYSNSCLAKKDGQEIDRSGMCAEAGPNGTGSAEGSAGPAEPETYDSGSSAVERTLDDLGTVSFSGELRYENAALAYGFYVPKKTYYSGFGSRDGASHSVGIGRDASPETFELSEVKVRFYKWKVLAELKNAENGFFEDSESGKTYLSLSGGTLMIEGDRSVSSDIINLIIQSAFAN